VAAAPLRLLNRQSVDIVNNLESDWHGRVRAIAGHRTADAIFETLHGQLVRHQFALSQLPGRPATSLPQHERVIEAIRDRDPKAAEQAMRDHIASVIEALANIDALGMR